MTHRIRTAQSALALAVAAALATGCTPTDELPADRTTSVAAGEVARIAAGGKTTTTASGDAGRGGIVPVAGTVSGPADSAGMSGMARMDHSGMAMGGMRRSAPRDSNQAFLRLMTDHHVGLVMLVDSAQARLQGATARADAQRLARAQGAESQRMAGVLARTYADSVTPMPMPGGRTMLDAVVRASPGAALDQAFYQQVIRHHREGVQLIDRQLPNLTGEVRDMATRMRAEHQREIQEFEAKARPAAAG